MKRLLPKMDTHRLLIYYYVCREKSITVAAEKLFLSQPTVTNHIKSLEDSIQMKLIQVDRKKLSLTKVGEGLYHYAQEIFEQAMAADRFIDIIRESSLYVGAGPLLLSRITGVVNDLSIHVDPSTRLEVKLGESFNLLKEVADSKIDLAVVPNLHYGYTNLSHIRIASGIELVFFTSPSHPIFKKSEIGWADLSDYPLVIGTEASSVNKIVSDKFISEGLTTPPKYYFTGYNSELFTYAVRNGDYISLALIEEVKHEVSKGILKVVPLKNAIRLDIDAVAYESHISIPLVQQFISFAQKAFLMSS